MANVNDDILNSILRHQHFVRAYENDVLKHKILPILVQAKKDMLKKLKDFGKKIGRKNLSQLTKLEKNLLAQTVKDLDQIIKAANLKITGKLDKEIPKFAKESEKINRMILISALPIKVAFNQVSLDHLKKLIDQPLGGKKYAERFNDNYREAVSEIEKQIGVGIVKGESMLQVRNRLIGVGKGIGGVIGDKITRRAEMIARSEIMRISNAVTDDLYRRNDDIVKGQMWVATLDSRTCVSKGKIEVREGWKDIKDVEVGNLVYTHKYRMRKVINKIDSERDELLEIRLDNGNSIEITADHEVLTDKGWIPVGELDVGDEIKGIKIVSKKVIKKKTKVYDITVEEDHSFLLDGIFVHNCAECAPMDGTEYLYERNERPPERPLHTECRCTTVAIIKSWEELGAKGSLAKKLDALDPGARASMTGIAPAKITYPKWFDLQPDSFKKQVLGTNRFQQYKDKGLSYDKMVKNGRWITLNDLGKMSKKSK